MNCFSIPNWRKRSARRGRAIVEQQQGVSYHIVARLLPSVPHRYADSSEDLSQQAAADAAGYSLGGWRLTSSVTADLHHSKRLPEPVISVGGITVGGSGKTPFVNYLAGALRVARTASPPF